MKDITIVSRDFIIIRTASTWYGVSEQYIKDQIRITKNPIFEKAYEMIKKEYGE